MVKQLEEATGSVVVGQIGRTVIIYRPSITKMKAEEKKRQARKVFVRKDSKPKHTLLVSKIVFFLILYIYIYIIFVMHKTTVAACLLTSIAVSPKKCRTRHNSAYLGVVVGEAVGLSSKVTFEAMHVWILNVGFWCQFQLQFYLTGNPVNFVANRRGMQLECLSNFVAKEGSFLCFVILRMPVKEERGTFGSTCTSMALHWVVTIELEWDCFGRSRVQSYFFCQRHEFELSQTHIIGLVQRCIPSCNQNICMLSDIYHDNANWAGKYLLHKMMLDNIEKRGHL